MKTKTVKSPEDVNFIIDQMKLTKDYRRRWITTEKPSITTILEEYPKFAAKHIFVCFFLSFFHYSKSLFFN